ncbi:MAG: serine protein kinase PrkA, partial [Deltaproteobacteria bacterium]|nr:serine protein kinase PrkA [Deltaproteobacteria bacterium]
MSSERRSDPRTFLSDLSQNVKQDFIIKKRVLSFEEYFALAVANPRVHARSASQYVVDCFRHFGLDGDRFRLFDVAFDEGTDRLVGQEECQQGAFRILEKFARQGKVDHLILLHGPNGSAKSTFINCVTRALEYYSSTDEGALYRFNWVFPSERIEKKALGFGGREEAAPPPKSYAYLEESEVDARIRTEMKDHPLYLVPKRQRRDLLRQVVSDGEFRLSETITDGDLSPLSRLVFDALLQSYNGDLARVLGHVQVERFFLSRRFRRGLVTVEPQLQVDAGLRQITLNRSLESLPKILQNTTLFEPYGDLVDANRGLIEYNDLLKKPIETFKYLLSTCEKSTVALPSAILHLDAVFIASSNDRYLRAFLEHPDWPSFRGRIELVRVPYLVDYVKETGIYESQVSPEAVGKHIAPHAMRTVGLFAVLTRLTMPRASVVPEGVREAVRRLTPLEKADLYALRRVPDWAQLATATELVAVADALREDGGSQTPYEGEIGASPREIKSILFNAAVSGEHSCLSPLAVVAGLEALIKDRSLYEFLRVEPNGEYQDHPRLIRAVQGRYLEWADDDVRLSMGLATEGQYEDLLARYATHANMVLKGEKVRNPITNKLEDPDTRFLEEVEGMIEVKRHPSEFRREVISTIGAWSLDNPGQPVPYGRLFQNLLGALREAFFERHP